MAATISAPAGAADPLPIFDAHVHYNDEATAAYPMAEVLRLFRESGHAEKPPTNRPRESSLR